jgi:hypothetical protein
LQQQLRRIDALDTKTGVLLAIDGVLAGLLFGRDPHLPDTPRGLIAAAAVALLASLGLGLVAFANRRYDTAPSASAVARFMSQDPEWLRWRFSGNVLTAVEVNDRKLAWKARLLTSALLSLIVSVTLLGGYFVYDLAVGAG